MSSMKVLVANRGEIACRVLRTLREMGVPSVALYTEPDRDAPHVWLADEAISLGEPRAYLDMDLVLAAAHKTGATAIHPGYGFLSQNATFARACAAAKVVFIGPSPEAMSELGDKRSSRAVAEKHGVPVTPGARQCDTVEQAQAAADRVGYPVLLKASGGGGGKGMRRVNSQSELPEAFAAARREAMGAFGDDRMLVEKYVFPARHVEVQILGDGKRAIALGERECSLQRRYQKIIEETPSSAVSPAIREALFSSAITLAEAVGYANAGTVEFLLAADGSFYFLEVNSRLQVEHPVTEMVTGLDIVAAQIEVAHGGSLPTVPSPRGHAIEARLNAEDPYKTFLPSVGKIRMLQWPQLPNVRVDAGVQQGSDVSPHYDSLLGKVIAWGATREAARQKLIAALRDTTLLGLNSNQSLLIDILQSVYFKQGETFTTTIEALTFTAPTLPPGLLEATEATVARTPMGSSAEGAGTGAGGAAGAAGRDDDTFSPWRTLGAFRMGQCG